MGHYVLICVAVALVFLISVGKLASAAEQPTHPANESEFVGYWRIILIDNDLHKSAIKNEQTGYSDPCQFFINLPDGSWLNISPTIVRGEKATKINCPSGKNEIDKLIPVSLSVSQHFKWSKLNKQNGLFYISDPATKNGLLWKADYVAEDLPAVEKCGFDLKKGDMIMQLARRLGPAEIAPVWPMILRPVQQ